LKNNKEEPLISQLRNVFETFITDPAEATVPIERYSWFVADENEVFGIQKEEISETGTVLLNMLFTPHNINLSLTANRKQK